jgi:hypothetical protein
VDFRDALESILEKDSPYFLYPEDPLDDNTEKALLTNYLGRKATGKLTGEICLRVFLWRFRVPLVCYAVSWFAISMVFVGLLI